jgi:hypothetical protein
VFVEPTVKEVLQLELGRIKVGALLRLHPISDDDTLNLLELFAVDGGSISEFES